MSERTGLRHVPHFKCKMQNTECRISEGLRPYPIIMPTAGPDPGPCALVLRPLISKIHNRVIDAPSFLCYIYYITVLSCTERMITNEPI